METPVSMMLLLTAAMVISAVIVTNSDDDDRSELAELRIYQAGRMASVVSDMDLEDDIETLPLHAFRNGEGEIAFTGDPGETEHMLCSILSVSPDELEVSVYFTKDPSILPPLSGSRFSRSSEIAPGLHVIVTLPLHRGSMHLEEDL